MAKSMKEYFVNFLNCLSNKSESSENNYKKYDINVSINESVEKKDENEKSNLLKLEIYGRLLIYGLIIGFIYNYTYYNIFYKFNIFDFLQPNDLLFSWFGSDKLVQMMFFFLFLYIIAAYYNKFNKKIHFVIFIITAIIYIALFFFKAKDFSFTEFFKYLDFSSAFHLIALTLIIISLSQFLMPDKEKTNINFIEIILVIGAFLFTSLNASLEFYENNKNSTFAYVQYKKIYDEKKFQDSELIFIGRTSTVSIFKCIDTNDKDSKICPNAVFESINNNIKYNSLIVLSNDDISNIIIKKEVGKQTQNDKKK